MNQRETQQGDWRAAGSLVRYFALMLACGLLSSCYLVPGQFSAHLHIHSDATFTYKYSGQITYKGIPSERPQAQWDDRAAICMDESSREPRPCRPEEIAAQRTTYENAWQRDLDAAMDIAQLTGINVLDDEANHRIAAQLMTQKGWKRAEYKGNAVFDVEYEMTDRLTRDFVFPSLPSAQMLVPFLTIRPAKDGRVKIEAAGLTSGIMGRMLEGNSPSRDVNKQAIFAGVNGTLRVTTDAKLTDTNGTKSSAGALTHADWTIRSGEVAAMVGNAPNAEIQLP